jgi:glutamyl/glutaminyl-tRNA synthetase
MSSTQQPAASNFIRTIIDADLASGKHRSIVTRFPPEPNGYLHVGHAKSICLNFGLAQTYQGKCNLRFDDTNPEKENEEYAQSIQDDVRWLGFLWDGEVRWASDYFEQLYQYAIELINKGLAYVDDLTPEQMREYRGTLTLAGKNSPYRERSAEENLDLFARMRAGWQPCAARQDRHVQRQHQPARSSHLPHPPRSPHAHRRPVVHLPDVRLHALHLRCIGRHHAFAVHAGIRRSPPALRLGAG